MYNYIFYATVKPKEGPIRFKIGRGDDVHSVFLVSVEIT
jgi:hypothetical protein